MNSEMIKFFLSSGVPCGFVDDKGKIDTNVKMTDLLYLLIRLPEMGTLLEKINVTIAKKKYGHLVVTYFSINGF